MKKPLVLSQAMLLLWLTIALFSCGSSESAEEKAQRPQKITKHWVIDSTSLRKEFDGYIEASWKAFENSIKDKDQIPQFELDSMKRFLAKKADVTYQKYSKLNFIFRPDGTYENRFPGATDAGTYRFNESFDVIQTKTKGTKVEYAVPLLALSNTEMQIQGGLPIVTGETNGAIYKLVFKYVPKSKS